MNEQFYTDPDLVQFYDIENGWSADHAFCLDLAKNCSSVLDLGCGTGALTVEIARSGVRNVVGVDPASTMLDVARFRDGGELVTWINDDARTFRRQQHFDLIMLTGHAFQCLLTAQDQLAVLQTIAKHLSPDGRFIFDSRNPNYEEWKEWQLENSRRVVLHPSYGIVDAWNDAVFDTATQIVSYQSFYQIMETGKLFSAPAQIAFPARKQLAAMMMEAGLHVDHWLGDWDGLTWSENSKEIIPIGRLI